MEERNFERVEQLIKFILEKCGGMSYWIDWGGGGLYIDTHFDIERIFYTIYLSDKNFNFKIKELYISNLEIDEIPDGWLEKLDTLKKLTCRNNNLRKLPKLPKNLKHLDCSDNQLIELPELPKFLDFLCCENNQLNELPKLPEYLSQLECEDNPGYNDWLKNPILKKLI